MGFFDKLKKGLNKTRENLTTKIEKLVIGYADIDDDFSPYRAILKATCLS